MILQAETTVPRAAHQFEDGYIERTIAVRIRDRQGEIEYAVGLNDATIDQFLANWPDDRRLAKELEDQDRPDGPQQIKPPAQLVAEKAGSEEPPVEGALINELELVRQFAEVATPHLSKNLTIQIGDQVLPLTLIAAEPSSRHHATIIVRWRFTLPAAETMQVEVRDRNFLVQPGGAKYALKTSGDTMLIRSNVAPILVRAQRSVLNTVSAWARWQAPVISVTVKRVNSQRASAPTSGN